MSIPSRLKSNIYLSPGTEHNLDVLCGVAGVVVVPLVIFCPSGRLHCWFALVTLRTKVVKKRRKNLWWFLILLARLLAKRFDFY